PKQRERLEEVQIKFHEIHDSENEESCWPSAFNNNVRVEIDIREEIDDNNNDN
ncbi:20867_t:CDS:2, partial [Racocetra persica]